VLPPPVQTGRPGPLANGFGARVLAWRKAHPRLTIAGAVVLGLVLLYTVAGGALAARLIAGRASERLGRPLTIGSGHGGLGAIVLDDVAIAGAPGQPPS
jgi:hypothetical protein